MNRFDIIREIVSFLDLHKRFSVSKISKVFRDACWDKGFKIKEIPYTFIKEKKNDDEISCDDTTFIMSEKYYIYFFFEIEQKKCKKLFNSLFECLSIKSVTLCAHYGHFRPTNNFCIFLEILKKNSISTIKIECYSVIFYAPNIHYINIVGFTKLIINTGGSYSGFELYNYLSGTKQIDEIIINVCEHSPGRKKQVVGMFSDKEVTFVKEEKFMMILKQKKSPYKRRKTYDDSE